ncbi:ABC transporter [Colletotrichum graminicola M1.001]|uniref:ABC transporter n=1 Tax=Colletotrichum graminicola (strain M1.001 / M2 / FGSC 10212) TaxID=645133 RepID=E3QFC8_COLGM|nr:ABC transporter [Colletotrichum graminicola M1.001]EFQ29566.1 ABC transporter [Colletotrichum graminicola M1.001]
MGFSDCIDDDSIGPDVQGCRDDFDFTLAFEQIFLSILPSVIFIALSLPRCISLFRKPRLVRGTLLKVFKITAFAIYAVLTLVNLTLSVVEPAKVTALFVASSALRFTAAICMSATSYWEHSRSPRPSVLLNAFLFLSTLFDATQARSLWLSASTDHELAFACVFLAATACKASLILLESWHKKPWLHWDEKDHSPEETAGLYGLATFFWLNPLFITGYKKILAVSDLFPLDKYMSADAVQVSFSPRVDPVRLQGRKHGLARELASDLAVPILLPVAPRIALVGLVFCQPFLIEALLRHLDEPESRASANKGYGLIGATILVYTGIPLATAFYWYSQERFLCMARACLTTAVYRKTVQSKASAGDDSAALTLMSADIERIRMGFMQLHEFWANPIQVALACWLLQRQLGAAFVAPIVVVAICVASSMVLMKNIGPRQMAWMQAIQKRVGQTTNVIGNMKTLKISGLATPVEKAIQGLRVSEVKAGGRFRAFLVGSVGIGFTPILLAPVFTLAVTSRNLDVTTIFTSISYLLLLSEPLTTLFQIAPQLLAALACLQRVQDFVQKESRHDFRDFTRMLSEKPGSSSIAIDIVNGSFGWDQGSFVLKNITVPIPAGFTMVVGPVASGKSTLCKALLGETPIVQGEVVMGLNPRSVGYCDQIPFLWNESIKDNIVGFSKTLDQERYAAVIEATMLSPDLLLFPQGDKTKVGSKGISLSGGQKRRISLARALYQQCDLLIADDVLSGLDADTEEQVFHRVFGTAGLLKARGTTAVLCTHATRHLPSADYIIALASDGTLHGHGTFGHLARTKPSIVHDYVARYEPNELKEPSESVQLADEETPSPASRVSSTISAPEEASPNPTRVMGDSAVLGYYFRSIGAFWMLAFAAFGVICGFFYNFPTVWLKFWSEDMSSANPARSQPFYLGLYALFQCLALGSLVTEAVIGLLIIIRISGTTLHKAALRTVFAAPLRFFTTTDTGVVTNLFSQDMTIIDGELPQALINTSLQTWIGIGTAAIVATSSPYVIVAYPVVLGLLYGIQRFYLRTSRQLRLLDLEAKSPLYTNFIDTIGGLTTIRAFGWSENAVRLNNSLLDTSQRPAYLLSMIQRWLAFVLGMVVAVLALFVVTLSTQLRSNAGFTGASMVSLMTFGKTLANLVQMYTMLETSIGAVSRIKSFCDDTARECLQGEDGTIPASWPENGRIEIKRVSASYRQVQSGMKDLALKDLTLSIEPGEKVALCGRTGSGKSSVVLLLLRLLDPLPSCSINMSIDGNPLHTIDRVTLRERIIAVPQDAVFLPDGTSFKTNLDPFGIATNEECQAVLESVGLWSLVCSRGGLEAGMNEDMLSQGQKQLFSLSRAVLRRRIRLRMLATDSSTSGSESGGDARSIPRGLDGGVLILDECTSNVDRETEKVMREIIRHEFERYTVLMVSHRLDMVMEFDKVFVIDSGLVVEQGVPRELVKVEDSRFKHLWALGGGE